MRPDALSRLLEASSLTSSSNAIVVDGTNGVLTAAVAERIGSFFLSFPYFFVVCLFCFALLVHSFAFDLSLSKISMIE